MANMFTVVEDNDQYSARHGVLPEGRILFCSSPDVDVRRKMRTLHATHANQNRGSFELDRIDLYRMLNRCNTMMLRANRKRALMQDLCKIVTDSRLFSAFWITQIKTDDSYERRQIQYCHENNQAAMSREFMAEVGVKFCADCAFTIGDFKSTPNRQWRYEALAAGHRTCLTLPVHTGQIIFGHAVFLSSEEHFFNEEITKILSEMLQNASHTLTRLEYQVNADREENASQDVALQQRSLLEHIDFIRVSERSIISRELHDELGQTLSALKLDIFSIERLLDRNVETRDMLRSRFQRMKKLVAQSFDELHRIVSARLPRALDNKGLGPALYFLANDCTELTGINFDIDIELSDYGLSDAIASTAFRCIQECLTNVTRHAKATRISLVARQSSDILSLHVADNGSGFDVNAKNGRFGLLGLHDRAKSLGGHVTINSQPGNGTSITIDLPLYPSHPVHAGILKPVCYPVAGGSFISSMEYT